MLQNKQRQKIDKANARRLNDNAELNVRQISGLIYLPDCSELITMYPEKN